MAIMGRLHNLEEMLKKLGYKINYGAIPDADIEISLEWWGRGWGWIADALPNGKWPDSKKFTVSIGCERDWGKIRRLYFKKISTKK